MKTIKLYSLILLVTFIACETMNTTVDIKSDINIKSPLNDEEISPLDVILKWSCRNAQSYSVYLDSIPSPETRIANKILADSIKIDGLYYNKDYYWCVVAFFEDEDSTLSEAYHFKTISPEELKIVSPQNNVEINPENIILKWDCATAISFSVYLDSNSLPVTKIADHVIVNSLNIEGIHYNQDYYWRVIAFFETGDSTIGEIYHFKTILPEEIKIISPMNNSEINPKNIVLNWDCPSAKTFSVYLDSNSSPETEIAHKIPTNSLEIEGVDYNKDYYWRVVAFFETGDSVLSEINKFKTIPFNPFSSVSELYIDFPQAVLEIYKYDLDILYSDSTVTEDTLISNITFSSSPNDCEAHPYCRITKNEYIIQGNKVLFNITLHQGFSSGNAGYLTDTFIEGYFEIDTLSSKMIIELNFNTTNHSYSTGSGSNSKWDSKITMEDVPYEFNGQFIEVKVNALAIENYLTHFYYYSESSSSNTLGVRYETKGKIILLDLIGFKDDKDFVFRIIP